LYKYSFSGKTVGNATITLRKAGGDAQVEYLVYKLTEVFISSVNTTGHDQGGIAQESVSLNFAKIEIAYTIQNDDGSAGASSTVTLDVKEHSVS
jgi:type VI secretion system secreted protein Hcp